MQDKDELEILAKIQEIELMDAVRALTDKRPEFAELSQVILEREAYVEGMC